MLVLLVSIGVSLFSQKKASYSLFSYTVPKGIEPDETDPAQKVYFIEVTDKDYLCITIWQKQKASTSAVQDYLSFVKQIKSYINITDYTREPTLDKKTNVNATWQTAYLKGTNLNILTNKAEPVSILLKLVSTKKHTAAIQIASNNMDRCKGEMNAFLKTVKLSK